MKSLFLTAVSLILTATVVNAQPMHGGIGHGPGFNAGRCLQMASNGEILNELNRRLNYTPAPVPNQPQYLTTLVCNYNTLKVSKTDMSTGKSSTDDFTLSTASQCETLRSLLEKAVNSNLVRNELVAVCNYNTLQKYLVTVEKDVKQVDSITYSTASQCETAAAQINQN